MKKLSLTSINNYDTICYKSNWYCCTISNSIYRKPILIIYKNLELLNKFWNYITINPDFFGIFFNIFANKIKTNKMIKKITLLVIAMFSLTIASAQVKLEKIKGSKIVTVTTKDVESFENVEIETA